MIGQFISQFHWLLLPDRQAARGLSPLLWRLIPQRCPDEFRLLRCLGMVGIEII
jgi:hypothetical protein